MIYQQEEPKREHLGMAWALLSLCQPSRRAHLLTTRKRVVVLPAAVVRSSRGARWMSTPAQYRQASRRHWRLVHRAELCRCAGGLGADGHQQAAPGIYRGIACYYK